MSFKDLKNQSKLGTLTSKLIEHAEEINNKTQEDNRYWKLTVDKSGNGYAIIRFLPQPEGEEYPYVRLYSHAFQGPGGWYIENSRTTLGKNEADPIAELNRVLWNSNTEANKEIARKQKRKLTFVSNIYVVKDSANPENEGKVFLFRYGKAIFDKIEAARKPEFEDEEIVEAFDLWAKGANFKLKARNKDGYRNYDSSEFDKPAALLEDDAELEKIWKSEYSLSELVSEDKFKSYDELKKRLDYVLGTKARKASSSEDDDESNLPENLRNELSNLGNASYSEDSDEDELGADMKSYLSGLLD
jgi:hypothetical protein